MSLRAIGEGHISSIVFRRGVIDAEGDVRIEPTDSCHRAVKRYENQQFERDAFRINLIEIGGYGRDSEDIFAKLPAIFTADELGATLRGILATAGENHELRRIADQNELQQSFFMLWRISATRNHVIEPGESLWVLTRRDFKIPMWLLRQYNPDLDLDRLHPGTVIVIPKLVDA